MITGSGCSRRPRQPHCRGYHHPSSGQTMEKSAVVTPNLESLNRIWNPARNGEEAQSIMKSMDNNDGSSVTAKGPEALKYNHFQIVINTIH
ncbi:hypothetical protein [Akkermansia muciniphila]|uniref:hypothetical protein n=1 Tax=Akkermansia muciniphila TaxID=239935 RepID=UPI0027D29CE9|nr:hypothetical protein [Akkermansia muciniphila]WMB16285.1 hypothetical protein O4G22_05145 [Akkermansia muciniphila]WMB20859.1 hypothetical protein O4G19_05185 [Akkermansia muciniphila]